MSSTKYVWISLVCCLFLSGCSRGDVCSDLSEKAKDEVFIQNLEKWVDRRHSKKKLVSNNSIPSSYPPGDYLLDKDDELEGIIGNDMNASVIVGADDRAEAVFFFRGSFRGVVVFLQGKGNTMISEDHLKRVTSRTSLLCIERD